MLEWTGKLVPQGLLVKGSFAPIPEGSVAHFLFTCYLDHRNSGVTAECPPATCRSKDWLANSVANNDEGVGTSDEGRGLQPPTVHLH